MLVQQLSTCFVPGGDSLSESACLLKNVFTHRPIRTRQNYFELFSPTENEWYLPSKIPARKETTRAVATIQRTIVIEAGLGSHCQAILTYLAVTFLLNLSFVSEILTGVSIL